MPTKRDSKAKDLVDAQLEAYRSMRDFEVTAEPSGKGSSQQGSKASGSALPFVIQKHAASHLHYDFRLGWNGVLKSWAVAKGPSYVTRDKRLAVQVEDHPMEYGGFEGIIPQGQYGGGTVMLWDTGTWEPQPGHTDVNAGLRDGSLKFVMHGTKMKGKWALIRMGGKAAKASKPNWLLIKEHDEFERQADQKNITDESPDSVITGRGLEQIAKNQDHVWNSKVSKQSGLPTNATQKKRPSSAAKSIPPRPQLDAYPSEQMPDFIPPQLASQADTAPEEPGWIHELKLDGYRIQAHKQGAKVGLLTRSGLDWTHRMKEVAQELTKLPVDNAILDGEIVVLSPDGTTSFANLQASFREGQKHTLTYFIFDLLHLNGQNIRGASLKKRKTQLSKILRPSSGSGDIIRFSEDIEGGGAEVFRNACKLQAEGIISKQASSKYTSGRSNSWIKVKCAHEQEFVIGGFTLPSNGSKGVGALLLGYYDQVGKLIYAGRTGTGFTRQLHEDLRNQLDKLQVETCPFKGMPAAARRGAKWVRPKLVAQVSFATWTGDHLVRQAAFKELREDKPAKEVQIETSIPTSELSSKAKETDAVDSGAAGKVTSHPKNRKSVTPQGDAGTVHAVVRLTHPDKIIDLETGLTKQQLADYYWAISEDMLRHIANRPLSLVRCPDGSTRPCFFQKHTNKMLPPGIDSVEVLDKKTGKSEPYITISTREALAGVAQIGVLEIHPWGSTNNDLEHPDRLIIDLDPDASISWQTLAASAQETRSLFKKLGLDSFLRSTGGKGLHIIAPIAPERDWATIKEYAHAIASQLERQQPNLYLTKMSKAARRGRIYVDYLRNERGATAVAAFSPRARAGVTVSMPLAWSELESSGYPAFRVAEFKSWKARLSSDPWKTMLQNKQQIDIDKSRKVLKK